MGNSLGMGEVIGSLEVMYKKGPYGKPLSQLSKFRDVLVAMGDSKIRTATANSRVHRLCDF